MSQPGSGTVSPLPPPHGAGGSMPHQVSYGYGPPHQLYYAGGGGVSPYMHHHHASMPQGAVPPNGIPARHATYPPHFGSSPLHPPALHHPPQGVKRRFDDRGEEERGRSRSVEDEADRLARRQSVISIGGSAGNGSGTPGFARPTKDDKGKRVKTVRACDSCRRKKIRCNPIEGTEPPICQHCKHHGFECTWFLPITETRFKRKREQEEQQGGAAETSRANSSAPPGLAAPAAYAQPSHTFSSSQPQSAVPPLNIETQPSANSRGPLVAANNSVSPPSSGDEQRPATNGESKEPKPSSFARVYGPTSMSYMMHSTTSFPAERMSSFDSKHYQRLEARCTGDGLIQVYVDGGGEPGGEEESGDDDREGHGPGPIRMPNMHDGGTGLVIPAPVAEHLVNYFFNHVAQLLPIMSRQDFLSTVPLSPLLFYGICGVSALHHDTDPAHRRAIRDVMAGMHRQNEMLAHSDLSTIQSLLLYTFSCEFERNRAGPSTWNGLGTAIRMGQGLGLHRESIVREQKDDHTELRRRIWGASLIADRWISAMFGLPMMIDLEDCDRFLPSAHDVRPGVETDHKDRPFASMVAMIELSILLGRVMKQLYSPSGILKVTDELANGLLNDLDAWHRDLDDDCKFKGDESTFAAGWLHLCSVPVRFLLYRPFMRISYQCPEALTFSIDLHQFNRLLAQSREAIVWVSKNPTVLEFFVNALYSFFTCCLIQYHAHVRRRDAKSLDMLDLAKKTLLSINCPECLSRNKVTEVVSLLHSTAATVAKWMDSQAPTGTDTPSPTHSIANPTAGATPRPPDPTLRWYPKTGDEGHFETDGDQSVVPGLVLKSASNSPATPQTLGAHANTSSLRSTVETSEVKVEAPAPEPAAPSAATLLGIPNPGTSAGWPQLYQVLPGLNGVQSTNGTGLASSINVNPTLNLEGAPLANATGSIDFFGSSAFSDDPLGWDWSKLFAPGSDTFGTGF